MSGAEHGIMIGVCPQRGLPSDRRAFTLIELLVVVGVITILVGVLVPSLASARKVARRTVCLANLRQMGMAIQAYASGNQGRIPYGPKAPPMMTASNFYPSTGAPTSLISLMNGTPVGLGLMLQKDLARQPKVLFCPGSDQPVDAEAELANVGIRQAQCSYYYRHGSVTRQYDDGTEALPPAHIQLDHLGENRQGRAIRALVMDTQFVCPSGFAEFNVKPRTHHQRSLANILFSDGHAVSQPNEGDRFTVDMGTYDALQRAFDRILSVLEQADVAP